MGFILKRQNGFTLVELLIVMAILAILAGIAVPMFLGQRSKAMRAEAETNTQTLRLLQEQYRAERGEYAPYDVAGTTTGILTGLTAIKTYLPGFKPGSDADLKFNYYLDYVVVSGITNSFCARAVGKAGTPVADVKIGLNQDNEYCP